MLWARFQLRSGPAVVNLVTNACYAMRARRGAEDGGSYSPSLVVGAEPVPGEVAVTF